MHRDCRGPLCRPPLFHFKTCPVKATKARLSWIVWTEPLECNNGKRDDVQRKSAETFVLQQYGLPREPELHAHLRIARGPDDGRDRSRCGSRCRGAEERFEACSFRETATR